ncbi:pyridoxamine 5'-phosphate oxidase family protein [Paenibacillus albiflavus]|uniref:Pyridoxamine 5'-phosphate oxidase family protein n=1 Tax=Paenibacillus albiflavus TaxID=2545760 RepID=A0A4R4EMV0_9BACL|nr:pyridoxamine 5'-phosphate oxidase family protein [Paenibacillus albiflavus]TCZ80893.1 pyridoxamine 5'-phosphate oxidase family protein [Paenibacillus albiflavus]
MTFFQNQITTEQELRDLLGYPSEVVKNKSITHLDEHCRRFLAQSPIAFLSTADANGECDVSPRGDSPGFVYVMDDWHLVIPERPGNRRMDSMLNILSNPKIGLIFLIPGLEETLRINGKACIIRDANVLDQMKVNDKAPLLGIGVEVEECYIHCAKAFKRSKLWQLNTWPTKEKLPSVARILADHANLEGLTAEDVEKSLKETYEKRLY